MASSQLSQQRSIYLFGGRNLPKVGLESFVREAGGNSATILIVNWATFHEDRSASFHDRSRIFRRAGAKKIISAPFLERITGDESRIPNISNEERENFFKAAGNASGIFFTGGVQARLMKIVEAIEAGEILRNCYRMGVVFGGTSAGAAAMSKNMIADYLRRDSNHPRMREGLGTLDTAIVEQSYYKKEGRIERLAHAVRKMHQPGIGVDLNSVASVHNERDVWILSGKAAHQTLTENISFSAGGSFKLSKLPEGFRDQRA